MAMTLVSTVTVGSGGAASIEFTGIAGTGRDLLLVHSLRSAGSNRVFRIRVNGDSGSNYPFVRLFGTGAAVDTSTTTDTGSAVFACSTDDTANTFGNGQLYIANYTASQNKSISDDHVNENNATTAYQFIRAVQWSNTAAITSVSISGADNLAQHSSASLYIIS
jgi:hypothetical protein